VFGARMIEMLPPEPEPEPERERAARTSGGLFEQLGARIRARRPPLSSRVSLVEQGRHDEALHHADPATPWAAPDDRVPIRDGSAPEHVSRRARGDVEHPDATPRDAIRLTTTPPTTSPGAATRP
jgi:hypothetical protein